MIYHCSKKINTIRTVTPLLHININSLKIKGCIDANKSNELISGLELFHGMITIREDQQTFSRTKGSLRCNNHGY
jgi:hypothetical protein